MTSAIIDLQVHTDETGNLVVQWDLEGEPTAADVATGASPEMVDHEHAASVPPGTTALTLEGLGPGRHFVSVAPQGGGSVLVASDRRLPFEGAVNFRDLGGYRTRTGGQVRWGRLFRADSLHGLTEHDLAVYETLGTKVVFDLRGESEQTERPNPFPSRSVPLIGRTSDDPESFLATIQESEDGERFLSLLYLGMVDHAAPRIGEIFTTLAGGHSLPAVFHCHAGKDRTGIVAALVLELLGVERETVLDDYELTARYRHRKHQEGSLARLIGSGMTPEAAAGIVATPRWAMQQALEAVDERHGGIRRYLEGPAGVGPEDLDRLVDLLVG